MFILSSWSTLFLESKVDLRASMLKFNRGLSQENGGSYENAVDGLLGRELNDCANSDLTRPPIWLSIDMGHLYSVSKIKLLSRRDFGSAAVVYVGKDAIDQSGRATGSDHKCDSYPTGVSPTNFTDFACSSIRWVQFITILRNASDLQVCEVQVYYNETAGSTF